MLTPDPARRPDAAAVLAAVKKLCERLPASGASYVAVLSGAVAGPPPESAEAGRACSSAGTPHDERCERSPCSWPYDSLLLKLNSGNG